MAFGTGRGLRCLLYDRDSGGLIASLILAVADDADYIVIVCLCFVLDVGYFI